MELIELVQGPLDGAKIAVPDACRRVFYAPAAHEAATYSIYPGNDEDVIPPWQKERIVGRYYRGAGRTDARWIPL